MARSRRDSLQDQQDKRQAAEAQKEAAEASKSLASELKDLASRFKVLRRFVTKEAGASYRVGQKATRHAGWFPAGFPGLRGFAYAGAAMATMGVTGGLGDYLAGEGTAQASIHRRMIALGAKLPVLGKALGFVQQTGILNRAEARTEAITTEIAKWGGDTETIRRNLADIFMQQERRVEEEKAKVAAEFNRYGRINQAAYSTPALERIADYLSGILDAVQKRGWMTE